MTSPHGWRRIPVIAAFLIALAPAMANAQADAKKTQAKNHYEKATRFYDVGRYKEAIDEYQAAYLLIEDPALLYNIAQAYRLWDKPEEAVRFYRNYLRKSPDAPNHAYVEQKITELDKIVEERRKTGGGTAPVPAPTETTATPPPPPPAPVPPPPPTTTLPPPMTNEPPPSAGEVQAGPMVPLRTGAMRTVGWSFVIGGGVMVATAGVAGLVASSKAKKIEDAAKSGGVFNPSVEKTGKTANTVAIASGLVGVAAGVTGAILLFTSRPGAETTAPATAVEHKSRVNLFGFAAPGYAGAGAQVTF